MKKLFKKPVMTVMGVSLSNGLMAASTGATTSPGITATRNSYSATPGQTGPVTWN